MWILNSNEWVGFKRRIALNFGKNERNPNKSKPKMN